MRFKLYTANRFYHDKETIKRLEALGFKFRPEKEGSDSFYQYDNDDAYVEINSLDQLLTFYDEQGHDLVINREEITIYDGYLE